MELGVSEGTASWGRFDMLGFVPDNKAHSCENVTEVKKRH